MIRVSAFPKCFIEDIVDGRMTLFDWIEMSTHLECQGLELYAPFLSSHDPGYLAEVRGQIESLGMAVSMMCYSPDFTIPDADARKKEVEKQIDIIRATAELGGDGGRPLSGQRRPDVPIAQGVDWVVECIEACLPEVEACGIGLAIENHYKDGYWQYPEFAQQKEVFFAIIDRIASPRFGVQYDPSNAVVAGDDPVEFLQRVKHRVVTMHASDRYLAPGHSLDELKAAEGQTGYADILQHGVTGQGLNDYDAIFRILREINYTGWISIEDGMNGLDEMKQSIDFLKQMRAKYFANK